MEDIDITIENAFRQAHLTADEYLDKCLTVLEDYDENSIEELKVAVELAKVCAQDFHTAVLGSKLQDIRDSINKLAEKIDFLIEAGES